MKRTSIVQAYVITLSIGAALLLLGTATTVWGSLDGILAPWLALVVLFGLTEHLDLNFHDEKGRIGLSMSEAILMPMLVSFPFVALVWGVALAMAFGREIRRLFSLKGLFNVAQYTLAIAAAGYVWRQVGNASVDSLNVANAAGAALAILLFPLLTQFLTSLAISLAEGRNFIQLFVGAIPAILISLPGSLALGLLFSIAYLSSAWTIVLFPFLLGVIVLGYRAMLRQQQERQRVESLHSATRVLASTPNLIEAITGFLQATAEIASTSEARLLLAEEAPAEESLRWWRVRNGMLVSDSGALDRSKMLKLFENIWRAGDPIIATEYGPGQELAREFGVVTLLAVPVAAEDHVVGALVVIDRVGTDEFTDADARLLQALANELEVALESHRLFAQVAEERERFARIFNGSKEGICLIDADGVVRAWNPALERITGYPATAVMGIRWSDRVMIRDSDQNRVEGPNLVTLSSDEVVEVVTRGGPTRWVSVVAGPVQSEGDAGGWVVLVRDVSAEHEVERAKSDFLSTISHELRTPLTTIKGSLQVLGRGTGNLPPDLTDQMIGVTTRGAERLERLVMNLLMVSQIESGVMPVFTEEISMPEIVTERVDSILRDHAKVDLQVEAKEMQVRADRERLSQVVEHVLDNALKFGGPEGKITISLSSSSGYAHLSVTDEGPGIPSADHERIFERFIRLGDMLTRETQGAGVGLFIAKSAVDAMEGHIWVEGEPGKGATFHVQIPLAHPIAVPEAEGA
ncbi:MAG: ATP-binding protein [Actinomycetota bacterium]|nr:ATP-binding protein [Actinomycetota bacterium]